MMKVDATLQAFGPSFSPTGAEQQCGLVFAEKNETGEVGSTGRYKGDARPYGSAMFCLPNFSTRTVDGELFAQLEKLISASRAANATDITLHLDVAYTNQCNLEFVPAVLGAIARLGVTFTLTCYDTATAAAE